MNTRTVAVGLPLVARGAIHGFKNLVIVRMLRRRICVATDARVGAVRGIGEFRLIDEERNCLSRGIGFEEAVIGVAIEAVTVFYAS